MILKLSEIDKTYVWQSLRCSHTYSTQNPNHILVAVQGNPNEANKKCKRVHYSLLPSAIISYVDYLEIVEARRNAKNGFIISLLAIGISIIIEAAQIYYQVTAVNVCD